MMETPEISKNKKINDKKINAEYPQRNLGFSFLQRNLESKFSFGSKGNPCVV